MIKFIIAMLISMFSMSAMAERTFIATNSDGTISYYLYSNTFIVGQIYSTITLGIFDIPTSNETRIDVRVKNSDCVKTFGQIEAQAPSNGAWVNFYAFNLSGISIGDFTAKVVCYAIDARKNSKNENMQQNKLNI